MKRTESHREYRSGFERREFKPMGGAIAQAKQKVLNEYAERTGEHARILRLALNEAEALAWQTDHPHLFFPVLASEKAQAALAWHRRQRALRSGSSELAFAE